MKSDQSTSHSLGISSKAVPYIEKSSSGKNADAFRKLNKLVNDKILELKNFPDYSLDLETFDWLQVDQDRNWWWQMQSLPFLDWYMSSRQLHGEHSQKLLDFCVNAICNWRLAAESNSDSPLAWHDHATAYRLRYLANWYVMLDSSAEKDGDFDLPLGELVASMLFKHLNWLIEEENYSKHTNHGFDQAMIVFVASNYFDHEAFKKYSDVSQERLVDELQFAFTEQGVHRENSPGYQKFMTGRLENLKGLHDLGDVHVSTLAQKLVKKAGAYLRAVTLPNGLLPIIGDTTGSDPGQLEQMEELIVHDYSLSGYVIVKGLDRSNKAFCLIFKNCHDTNYHRHDDDLMLYFFYDGEVVLGDGGLYKLDESDPVRQYLRSPWAHSLPIREAVPVRDVNKLLHRPNIFWINEHSFTGESWMFGTRLTRTVDFSEIRDGIVSVCDEIESVDENLTINFYFDKLRPFSMIDKNMFVDFDSFKFDIECVSEISRINLSTGWHGEQSASAVCSQKYREFQDAFSISFETGKRGIYLLKVIQK
jgi:hypothetical protein